MESFGDINSPDLWLKANNELNDLLDEKETYWKQRSREDWLNLRDRNTKWFHHHATTRNRMNRIDGLLNDNGVWVSDEREVRVMATSFFYQMFDSSNPNLEAIRQVTSCVQLSVTEDHRQTIDKIFSRVEVIQAINSMHPNPLAPMELMQFFTKSTGMLLARTLFPFALIS